MRASLALAVVIAACGSSSDPSAPSAAAHHGHGTIWRFHVGAGEDPQDYVAAGDRLFVVESRGPRGQNAPAVVRELRAGGVEAPPVVLDGAWPGGIAIARDGDHVLAAWGVPGDGVMRFRDLGSPDHKTWTSDARDQWSIEIAAAGAGGGWIVCTSGRGGSACARVERGRVGPWHPLPDLAGLVTLHMRAGGEHGVFLMAGCGSPMDFDASCKGAAVVRLDRDGNQTAIRWFHHELGEAAALGDDLLIDVEHEGTMRLHGPDLAVDKIPERLQEITEAPGGVLALDGQETLSLWTGTAPPRVIARDLIHRLPPAGDWSDLLVRTWPDGLILAWKWTTPAHDDPRDLVLWRPEP